MKIRRAWLFLIILGYVNRMACADLDFSGGFSSHGNLTANGHTSFVAVGPATVARLTDNGLFEASSLFSTSKQYVGGFEAQLVFRITGDVVGDGFTFAVQNNSPTALGTDGGALGYTSITHSIAFKFDIYGNYPGDPGTSSVGLFTNGIGPLGGIDPAPSGINLYSKDEFSVHLAFNGSSLTTVITDLTKAAHPSLTKVDAIDVASVIGSSDAYVGFTAGTGNATSIIDIESFTFISTPEPSALGLFVVAALVLAPRPKGISAR